MVACWGSTSVARSPTWSYWTPRVASRWRSVRRRSRKHTQQGIGVVGAQCCTWSDNAPAMAYRARNTLAERYISLAFPEGQSTPVGWFSHITATTGRVVNTVRHLQYYSNVDNILQRKENSIWLFQIHGTVIFVSHWRRKTITVSTNPRFRSDSIRAITVASWRFVTTILYTGRMVWGRTSEILVRIIDHSVISVPIHSTYHGHKFEERNIHVAHESGFICSTTREKEDTGRMVSIHTSEILHIPQTF